MNTNKLGIAFVIILMFMTLSFVVAVNSVSIQEEPEVEQTAEFAVAEEGGVSESNTEEKQVEQILTAQEQTVEDEELKTNSTFFKGKNDKTLGNSFSAIYVKDFIRLHPEIEAISYIDNEGNTVGFINFLGGVGENFIMRQGKTYEIITKEDTTINVA